ncbi:MAG: carbohydrate porin [Balneolaceae bacterium]
MPHGKSLVLAQDSSPSFFKNLESEFTFTSDIFANVYGGLETGIIYMDNIDVELDFNAKGFSFFFYGLGNQGNSLSDMIGDVQVASNIDTENSWRMYEAWAQKTLPSINSSLLVGLYDLNSEYDVVHTGGLFLNSSHGIGPDLSSSGINGPSIFPLTSLSARLKINPIKGVSLKFAVLDGVPSDPDDTKGTSVYLRERDGALLISEISFTKFGDQSEALLERGVNEDTPFRIVFGGWKYTKEREGWLGEMESDHGVYVIGELSFANGFSFYGRTGATNRDINRYNYYLGAGFSYSSLFKNRPNDILGLAISLPINSDDFVFVEERNGNDFSQNETNIELTYLLKVSDHVSFQVDTQYIQNPNQAPGIEDAFIVGIRSVFGF